MSAYILIGANSTICQQLIADLDTKHSLFLLTRDTQVLPSAQCSQHHCYSVDPKNLTELLTCFQTIIQTQPTIDGVVNFPGSLLLKPAHLTTAQQWQETLAINLTTAFNAVHATAKLIKANCQVILMSSAAATIGLPNHEAIAAAKAGVIGLARSAAASYAAQNLRVNVIAPGLVATDLTQPILNSAKGTALSQSLHTLGRLGQPEHITRALTWLLDPLNDWTTGTVLTIDGGLSTTKTPH